jgi:cytochrome c peroxidase
MESIMNLNKRSKDKRVVKLSAIVFATIFAVTLSVSYGEDELQSQAKRMFGILPKVMESEKNPITPAKVKLGKILCYEPRISADGTVSCSRCHQFSLYATDGLPKAIGNNCKINPRNSPTILNAAGQISEHWIGNRKDVEDQAMQALTGPPSFGMPSNEAVEKKLREIQGYEALFKEAFPNDKEPVTVKNFGMAVGAFERTLVTPATFDTYLAGDSNAMNTQEKKGLKAFIDIGCSGCHSGTYVGGQAYMKFGLIEPYWKYTKSKEIDDGIFSVTKLESDKYVFKVPVLRNVAKTSPYFHDGSIESLEMAEWIMGKIQIGRELSKDELGDIHTFLESLTGEIPKDALTVPILPSNE